MWHGYAKFSLHIKTWLSQWHFLKYGRKWTGHKNEKTFRPRSARGLVLYERYVLSVISYTGSMRWLKIMCILGDDCLGSSSVFFFSRTCRSLRLRPFSCLGAIPDNAMDCRYCMFEQRAFYNKFDAQAQFWRKKKTSTSQQRQCRTHSHYVPWHWLEKHKNISKKNVKA